MKNLSEYENEDALDLLADLIEPATEIFTDKEIVTTARKGGKKTAVIKAIIKNHKKAIIEILARLENTPVEKYKCNFATLPSVVLKILNDTDLLNFFTAASPTNTETSGGNVTENTEGKDG